MKAGMTKNSAGIGGKIESLPCMGASATITGGSDIQRRHARMYGKKDHLAHDKLMRSKADSDDATPPLLDVSTVRRVF
jgi:hypothetical protein